jgi:hypothetical protein
MIYLLFNILGFDEIQFTADARHQGARQRTEGQQVQTIG